MEYILWKIYLMIFQKVEKLFYLNKGDYASQPTFIDSEHMPFSEDKLYR